MSDGPADVMTSLRSAPVFRDVPEAVLQRLAPSARLLRLSRNEPVFQRGQTCEGLHLLLAGQVKVYARVDKAVDASPDAGTDRGHEKVIEVVMAPACLGESMLGGEATHSVNATMLTDGVLLLLPREAVMRELHGGPDLAIHLLADVSDRVNRLVHDIEALTLRTASERVVAYLLRDGMVDAQPVVGDVGPCTVLLPASKGTIASLLSVTPEHFSRILHDLQSRGLIAVNRRQIHIPDVQRLACHA